MKNIILIILLLIFRNSLFAQQTGSQLFVMHFTNKGLSKEQSINPSAYLSESSVERRFRKNIPFDQYDIPVNEQYVKTISGKGAKILARSRWFNCIVFEATPASANSLLALPFVADIKPLETAPGRKSLLALNEPFFEKETSGPWNSQEIKKEPSDIYDYGAAYGQINQVKGQFLHNFGFSGQGMTIAVIDAGFNSVDVMTCFDSLRKNNQILGTHDFAVPGNNVYATSMNQHGTMVLSCMGANIYGQMIGTAPKANYWLLRSEVAESESIIEEYYWVSAAEFADSVGADMINSSLGYTTFDNPAFNHTYADMDGKTTVVTRGAEKAAEKGILVVNSAGNAGASAWKYIGAPADGDSVFTIGAIDASGVRSSFSSVGPTFDGRIKPTVAARGSATTVFGPSGLTTASGTSFSSPIICGITSCLWQALPQLSNMQIIEAIKATASMASNPDTLLGWGIPDYNQALLFLSSPDYQVVKQKLNMYPNPVITRLTIELPEALSGNYSIEIVNLEGNIVYKHEACENSVRNIQIEGLNRIPSGIYFVKVTSAQMFYSGKIIKR